MLQPQQPTTNGSGPPAQGRSPAALLRELQDKLARYDELDEEIAKLGQEQRTLEDYVKNLMDSAVFT
ncbi:hypothetical protein GGF46_004052 [Coemansia sp. RSA 552]|nr:hypothetical protein GGF46_004052 [Coemansia sp. RSA 552]